MSKLSQKFNNFGRKIIIKLKYHPNVLPMLVMIIGFVVFSLNLTNVSETTLAIGKKHMGLFCFVSYLLSILSMVCLLNSFPRREKVKIPFIVLTVIMMTVIIVTNVLYLGRIAEFYKDVADPSKKLNPNAERLAQIASANVTFIVNIIFEGVALLLLAALPLIKKALGKVNTRVQISENENISSIDISND